MIHRAYLFRCDICGETECFEAENALTARREAKTAGWIAASKNHCYCCHGCHLDCLMMREGSKCVAD